nr:MAG TPA: hypothetical protein [Caudoviricetes sp.]
MGHLYHPRRSRYLLGNYYFRQMCIYSLKSIKLQKSVV